MTTIKYGDRVQFNINYGDEIPRGTLATAWGQKDIAGFKIAYVTFDDRSMGMREVFVSALDYVERCGEENSDYPGEYACSYPKGHDPIVDEEGNLYEHASPYAGAWWNDHSKWTPTIANCDNYMDERTGKYEYRKVRYDAAIQWMLDNGLKNGMTVVDVGAGMTEFAYCMMHDWNLNVRYIPVDGGIDGTNLETWVPPREAHFFVALELLEHLHNPYRLLVHMQVRAKIGVVVSTPNPETTDVIGMDPTHVKEIHAETLRDHAMNVEERTFYGGVFSDGKPDSLFGTWTRG